MVRNKKEPETARRIARINDANEWIITEVPSMRIVSDELYARARARRGGRRTVRSAFE
ncbi:hypothetical protein [Sinorhizobium fredii]|uniref:hypothetical protein n=1 Tax=Rhizobium fredii TaxID=380 RepID=UPI003513242F